MPTNTKYEKQRTQRTPPHVSLTDLRAALGITLDELIARMDEVAPGKAPSRGALSAIEHGHRGASPAMLRTLAMAYGLKPGAITTDYEPRGRVA